VFNTVERPRRDCRAFSSNIILRSAGESLLEIDVDSQDCQERYNAADDTPGVQEWLKRGTVDVVEATDALGVMVVAVGGAGQSGRGAG